MVPPPIRDWPFWLAVAGATVFRLISSPMHSVKAAVAGTFGGLFAALVFTDPVLAYFNFEPDIYKTGLAALLTLTGESLMRFVMLVARDPKAGIEVWKVWKGK